MHRGNATASSSEPSIAPCIVMVSRLTTNSAAQEAATAASREINTVGQSYRTMTGSWKASMPM
jgi:hypothetical protein